jgi:hypothetical protein
MSFGKSQQPVVTTQTNDPWAPAQPFLQDIMQKSQNLYTGDVGYQPYLGKTQAEISPKTQWAMDTVHDIASAEPYGSKALQEARGLSKLMVQNGGLSQGQMGTVIPGMEKAAGQFQSIYDDATGTENPYLQAILEANNRRISDKVNSGMSGAGRYGSGAHTDVLTRALAESANPILAEDYAARQNRRLQANQGMLGAYGQMDDTYSGGLGRALQYAGMIPSLDAARYAGAERVGQLGAYEMGREQDEINSLIERWNLAESRPWEQLARYAGSIGGMGGLGGTQVTQRPSNAAPLGQTVMGGALSGALLGSKFFPGIGTLAGAGLGGLMGAL